MTHERETNHSVDWTKLSEAKQQLAHLLNDNPATADNFQGVGLGNGFLQVYLKADAPLNLKAHYPKDFDGIPIVYRTVGPIKAE